MLQFGNYGLAFAVEIGHWFNEAAKIITVSDPTQLLTNLTVTISGRKYPVTLPDSPDAGSSVTIALA